MALKLKLTKEEYAALSDAIKAEYKADGDGYSLDVSGIEDTGALRRAHDRVKQELADAKAEADAAKTKLASLGDEAARKAGDIATLEKSWQEKMNAEISARDSRNKLLESSLKNAAIEAATTSIVSKLTDHTAILTPHVRSRVTAEIDPETGAAVTRILGADGKVSAMTAEDLSKEFSTNKEFSAIIRVSKSSGGGANGTGTGNGNANRIGTPPAQDADLSRASPAQLAARIAEKKGTTA